MLMRKPNMAAVNQLLDSSVEDGVAVVSINSPPVNTLSVGVRDGLAAAFKPVRAPWAAAWP